MQCAWLVKGLHSPSLLGQDTLGTLNHGLRPLFCCFIALFGAGGTPDPPWSPLVPPGPPGAPMTPGMSSQTIVSHPGSLWVIFDPTAVNNPRPAGGGVSRQTHHPLIHIRFRHIRMRFFLILYSRAYFDITKALWKSKKLESFFSAELEKVPSFVLLSLQFNI